MAQPTTKAAPANALYGYYTAGAIWVAVQVDANGKIVATT